MQKSRTKQVVKIKEWSIYNIDRVTWWKQELHWQLSLSQTAGKEPWVPSDHVTFKSRFSLVKFAPEMNPGWTWAAEKILFVSVMDIDQRLRTFCGYEPPTKKNYQILALKTFSSRCRYLFGGAVVVLVASVGKSVLEKVYCSIASWSRVPKQEHQNDLHCSVLCAILWISVFLLKIVPLRAKRVGR